jgi:hypothetical protein
MVAALQDSPLCSGTQQIPVLNQAIKTIKTSLNSKNLHKNMSAFADYNEIVQKS